jgi:hypothetical protein
VWQALDSFVKMVAGSEGVSMVGDDKKGERVHHLACYLLVVKFNDHIQMMNIFLGDDLK